MSEKQKTILILEDDMLLLKAAAEKLGRSGCRVLQTRTFEQAMIYVKDEAAAIDLIWLDHYLLGVKTGLDFLAALRADPRRRATPVFVVSNTGDSEVIKRYHELGVEHFYAKADFRLEDIVADIDNLWAKQISR